MNITDRIEKLRDNMASKDMDAYIIPSSDPHMSEYVAPHWESRKWISGFTGSAGTVVITKDFGGLWTDGRYYVQAAKQLEGSGIELFKAGLEGVLDYIQWIKNTLKEGSNVGIDGRLFSVLQVRNMEGEFSKKSISLIKNHDLFADIWLDRPQIPDDSAFIYDVKYAGKSPLDKLKILRGKMAEKGVNYHLISSLDDIAWLYNIRGRDIAYNPLVISHALVSNNRAWLFIQKTKLSKDIIYYLEENGIEIEDYEKVDSFLQNLALDSNILLDPNRTNSYLYDAISKNALKEEDITITTPLKAVKNEIELQNLKKAHIRDGAAMVKFLYWLDQNISGGKITEISAADKLEEFRSIGENYIGLSFPTIAGYKDHGAIVHYQAEEGSEYTLKAEGMVLIDSGCQYLDGTTDITRTIPLGPIGDEEKRDYTLTLKGHIMLSQAKFIKGTTGANLDVLARLFLWQEGLDYKHGTGHGVGHFLNVHEGPQGISPISSKVKLEQGMVVTNEPGFYREGSHGIRIENELLVVEDEVTQFGHFLRFEPITYCPIQTDAIDRDLLDNKEKDWLNKYHERVYETLSPLLNQEERLWLRDKTRPLL